ncbi:MAG: hypothetical protein ACYTGN_14540 [Planctomycetota bacterium]|jgi:hypothetical protein
MVRNEDTGFTLSLSQYRPAVLPGESVDIDLGLDWHDAPQDVDFDAIFATNRLTATFAPETSSGGSQLTLTVAADAPVGLRIPIKPIEGAKVLVDGAEIASTVVNDTEILMHLEDGLPSGVYDITVRNPDGAESNAKQFFVE